MSSATSRPSFLHDVLTTAGQAELSDLRTCITDVAMSLSQLKIRIYDYMKSMYVDIDPLLRRDINFVQQADRLSVEMETLFSRIEAQTKRDLANSTAELSHLHDTLKENSLTLSISSDLIKIDILLRNAEKASKELRFLDAAEAFTLLEGHLKDASSNLQLLDIYKPLTNEFLIMSDDFCQERIKSLSSYVFWEENDIDKDTVRFSLKVVTGDSRELVEITQALHILNMLGPWIRKLQSSLMRSVLLPLIEYESFVSVSDTEKSSILNVDVFHKSRKPSCLAVLSNLTKCFEFIHGELEIVFKSGDSFLSLLGLDIYEEFCNALVTNCLKDTVPSTSAREGFSEVLEKSEHFHIYLSGIGFVPEEHQGILDFVRNVDVLSTNKTCELYLSKAREIMKKDLQDMTRVTPQAPSSHLEIVDVSTMSSSIDETQIHNFGRDQMKQIGGLIPNLFQFPECCVSKSSLELLNIVSDILNQAKISSSQGVMPLFNTARSVFHLYMAVVPIHHEKFLSTIPQQVALFHNNCMYLAHHLLILGFEVEDEFCDQETSPTFITFVDLVKSLRDLGTSSFLKHMQYQRKLILDIVKSSGLATLGESSNLAPDTEKPVRQCLRQLEILGHVWNDVLPKDVFNKSMGILVNAFVEELVIRVTSVEDIPANTATKLTSLFETVSQRVPEFFLDKREVVHYVKKWQKFQELITVLQASLRDIEERWADGKGPLALEFTMEQVKQLIRALFQNTNRRAEVLAKIR